MGIIQLLRRSNFKFLIQMFPCLLAYVVIAVFNPVSAQSKSRCDEIPSDSGYRVQAVDICARWVPAGLKQMVDQLTGPGLLYSPLSVNTARELVRTEWVKNESQINMQFIKGATSALLVTSEVCAVAADSANKLVTISIRPYYIRIDLLNAGNNVLPIPRSARPTFYDNVPLTLRILSPVVAITTDRRYGTALGLATQTDLLHLPSKINTTSKGSSTLRLDLSLLLKKSLTDPFYNAGTRLELSHPIFATGTLSWNAALGYSGNSQPLGNLKYTDNALNLQFGLQGFTKSAILHKYAFGVNGAYSGNTTSGPGLSIANNEKSLGVYAVADGLPAKSFSRAALYFNAGFPGSAYNNVSYQQLAARLGYSLVVGNGHSHSLIEATAGAGHTWGNPPLYSRYFGGNNTRNFLYDPISSIRKQGYDGALIRSLGQNTGGYLNPNGNLGGGTSFWHLNLSASLPVNAWMRPLIPDIVISDEPRVITLRSALKAQARTVENAIIEDLVKNQHLPDNDTTAKKAKDMVDKDIRPALNYLADRANIYSIKPVLLFDIGGIADPAFNPKTWVAAGAGIQLTIVIARLELGYMHTLTPATGNAKGNFLVRFVLENFY